MRDCDQNLRKDIVVQCYGIFPETELESRKILGCSSLQLPYQTTINMFPMFSTDVLFDRPRGKGGILNLKEETHTIARSV